MPVLQKKIFKENKKDQEGQMWHLTPIIPVIQEVEIKKITVQG
jgi:hypothetical protein